MKTTHKILGYSMDWNPDGTRKGKVRVACSLDVDGSLADATVVRAVGGTEETITGTMASHVASLATTELGITVAEADVEF